MSEQPVFSTRNGGEHAPVPRIYQCDPAVRLIDDVKNMMCAIVRKAASEAVAPFRIVEVHNFSVIASCDIDLPDRPESPSETQIDFSESKAIPEATPFQSGSAISGAVLPGVRAQMWRTRQDIPARWAP